MLFINFFATKLHSISELFTTNIENMKKIAILGAVLFVLALSVQSCKSTADCPAYSKAEMKQSSVKA